MEIIINDIVAFGDGRTFVILVLACLGLFRLIEVGWKLPKRLNKTQNLCKERGEE